MIQKISKRVLFSFSKYLQCNHLFIIFKYWAGDWENKCLTEKINTNFILFTNNTENSRLRRTEITELDKYLISAER